ncbi:MAG: hypothetical protein CBB71_13555 [Rhodopirellula sp. TMED11]|nr:MAG: hypothetical protein CBB71_13555 [Rhodopirellula sp. TMED11]
MPSRVLIVDDDCIVRHLLSAAVQRAGLEAVEAEDGDGAYQKIRDQDIRLVVTDWQMPNMDGLQLCRKIRESNAAGYVYVILLTSMDRVEERVQGLSVGADDFICKPFHPAEVIARLNVGRRVLQLETREALIFSLAKLAESRDPDTGHHIERVQCYTRMLAEELAKEDKFRDIITPQYIHLIYQTSPLHDIGKVGVPDHVLLKAGKLTPEEFDLIKRHPLIGAETLKGAMERSPEASFLRMAHDIALSHHEKWDGSGYPFGIRGQEIPLSARIVALADVYDALTTRRVYKDEFTDEEAAKIINDGSGKHFDPEVVQAFQRSREVFRQLRLQLQDSGVPGETDCVEEMSVELKKNQVGHQTDSASSANSAARQDNAKANAAKPPLAPLELPVPGITPNVPSQHHSN